MGLDRTAPVRRGDAVIVEPHAAVEDHEILVVRRLDEVAGLGIDGDRGRVSEARRPAGERQEVGRIQDVDAREPAGGRRRAAEQLGLQARIGIEADHLAAELGARHGRVPDRAGVEAECRVRDVGDDVGGLVAALRIEVDGGAEQVAGVRDHRPLGQGADVIEHRMRGPEAVAEGDVLRRAPFGRQRAGVLLGALEVAVDEPVVSVARDDGLGERAPVQHVERHAEIRQPVQVGVEVVRRELEGIGGLQRHGHGCTGAIVEHVVAAGDVGFLEQAVDADGEGRADHLVDVDGDALGVVAADLAVGLVEVLEPGLLGDDVDRAARGAATGEGRGRPAQDLDLLGEEVLADAHRRIADAVDEDVVARIEAADEEPVAEGVAALARAEGDAGGAAGDLAKTRGVLVGQDLLRQHRHGLRRVEQRLGEPVRGQAIGLVGGGRISVWIPVRRPGEGRQAGARGAGGGGGGDGRGGDPAGAHHLAQGGASPDLGDAGPGRRRAGPGDRCIDGHGREGRGRSPLSLGAPDRAGGNDTGQRDSLGLILADPRLPER